MRKAYIYNNSDNPILTIEFDEYIEDNRKNGGIFLFRYAKMVCYIPLNNLFFIEEIDKDK